MQEHITLFQHEDEVKVEVMLDALCNRGAPNPTKKWLERIADKATLSTPRRMPVACFTLAWLHDGSMRTLQAGESASMAMDRPVRCCQKQGESVQACH